MIPKSFRDVLGGEFPTFDGPADPSGRPSQSFVSLQRRAQEEREREGFFRVASGAGTGVRWAEEEQVGEKKGGGEEAEQQQRGREGW